ncbi:MAG TPA: pyridine nucleotide-disulfide oxidoreductase, partial [Candidatus Polarisedimenticolia bacterium]|nr:pyridine nucleotide-disulfide oxidoreductase [Candidatus Polarisedimenticolia bacterium]
MTDLSLAHGLAFADLYSAEGLARLDAKFRDRLPEELRAHLDAGRNAPPGGKDESALLIELAPHVEDFIAELFGIRAEMQDLAATHHALAPIFTCKRLFVQRQALKAHKPEAAEALDGAALQAELENLFGEPLSEAAFARHVGEWEKDTSANAKALDLALRYAAWATLSPSGRAKHAAGVLFKAPRKLDPMKLVPLDTIEQHGAAMVELGEHHRRRREGFKLTDPGTDLIGA